MSHWRCQSVTSELSPLSREWCCTLRLTNLRQDFLRFAGLPLRIVETLARLPEIHLPERRLRISNCPQREVQPLTRFAQLVELGFFRGHGGKPDRVHY